MFFAPAWISNLIFLGTCYLCGYQHVQLKRPNSVTNIQFVLMAFSLAMIVVIAFFNRLNVWLSWGFLLMAIGCLAFTLRQQRMLPAKFID